MVCAGATGAELKACCTEAGMFALRERRMHVTQEDFEMAVGKVMKKNVGRPFPKLCCILCFAGLSPEHVHQEAVQVEDGPHPTAAICHWGWAAYQAARLWSTGPASSRILGKECNIQPPGCTKAVPVLFPMSSKSLFEDRHTSCCKTRFDLGS
eukprot:1160911-Pelagomonas_calceolata.AAC.23